MDLKSAARSIIEKTAAIVVIYNNEPAAVVEQVDGLLEQFSLVFVVDNTEDASWRAAVEAALDARSVYISMGGNTGLGAAQNRGIAEATRSGAAYFVTFDQDSRPGANFLSGLIDGFLSASERASVAAIGPRAVDMETGDDYDAIRSNEPFAVATTLSSGLFLTREALNTVGPMDESLFIDLVDWEWCFRARAKGLEVMIEPRVTLGHKLGERHTRIPLLGRVGTPQPWRHYYAFRNYLLLCGRGYVPFSWKLKYLVINKFKLLTYPLFMERGGERLRHMLAGLADGLRGRSGKRQLVS